MTDKPLADVIAMHPPVHTPPPNHVRVYPGDWPTVERIASASKLAISQRLLAEAWFTVDCAVIGEESGVGWPKSREGVVCIAETPELAAAIADAHNRDGGHVL